ncbi:MAG: hypothetical protein HY855_02195 [Burkholderiales bacterium]|nr:hypothetical protein [Burkholderiales bacterium]
MGAFDDLIPAGGAGAFDDLIPRKKRKDEGGTAGDYGHAIAQAVGEGVLNMQAGLGTFVQAPAANTLSGVAGARALADRGITAAMNWVAPGSATLDEDAQTTARQASRFAAEQRAANADTEGGSWLNPRTAIARIGLGLEQDARGRTDEIQAKNQADNPELVRQQQEVSAAEGFVPTVKAMAQNPMATAYTLARSAPDMVAGLGLAKAAASKAMSGAGAAAEAAAARAAAAGADAAAQAAAAKAVIDQAGKLAVARASTVGTLAEAASSANSAREGVYREVMGIPATRLVESPRFREILVEAGGDAARAQEILANELADQAVLAGAGTMLGSALTRRIFGGDTTAKAVAGQRIGVRDVIKNVAEEGTEEGLQGVPEDLAQHGAVVQADPAKKFDLGGTLAQNMVAGALMGGGGSTIGLAKQTVQDWRGPAGAPSPPAGPDAPAGPSGEPAINADEVLGATAGTAPTAAEKALTTPPREATALDRVQAIDQEIAAKPADAPEVAALQAERDALTKDWPKLTPGAETSFSTEAGARLGARYALVEADDLVTSHDVDLRPNPAYPKELQPRERDRAASAAQISGIVQKIDPARLGLSADAATGAPIIGADGLVESGNARSIALARVYQANGQKAEDYRAYLRDNAAQFGLTPEAVAGMRNPVLVRVRTTPVNRAEFARQANASTVAQMSPAEQARSDAARIEAMDDLQPDESGDFTSSRDFIRRFVARLPMTEQAGMIDASGQLSSAGYARVRNAVLAKAYGDSPVLARMVESMDDSARNISRALMIAAPRVAQARAAIGEGRRFDADLTPHLVEAAQEIQRLKDAGQSVSDALAQAGVFGETYSPETRAMLQFLADNARRPRRMAEFITAYFDALDAAGDPAQGSLLGDTQAPAKADLMAAARRTTEGAPDANATNPERGNAGETAPDGPSGRGQPEDAAGDRRGGQGDGTAPAAGGREEGQAGWVNFPPESGTLGIPRPNMPQVKVALRPQLYAFLKTKGIDHQTEDVAADELKPTQAEYSPAKAEAARTAEGDKAAVLVSSDGYVLDGHHRWISRALNHEPVQIIRFNAPIDQLLDAVREFSGTTTSNESAVLREKRQHHVEAFYDAAADLAQIMSRHTRAAMVPEDTPDLMPTLVKLFSEAVQVVGTDLKRATAWVKERLRAMPELKAKWNRISNETYQKAALRALEAAPQNDLAANDAPAETDADRYLASAKRMAAKWQAELGGDVQVVLGGSLVSGLFVQAGNEPIDLDVRFLSKSPESIIKRVEAATGLQLRKEIKVNDFPVGTSTGFMVEGVIEVDGMQMEVEGCVRSPSYVGWANYYRSVLTHDELEQFKADKLRLKGEKKAYKALKSGMLEKVQARAIARGVVPAIEYKTPETWQGQPDGKFIDEHGFERGAGLNSLERAAEQWFYERMRADRDGVVSDYLARFPGVVDADLAKELSPIYHLNKSFANAVHEPSSALSKAAWGEALARDSRSEVIVTAGGAGSGKSVSGALARGILGLPADALTFDSALTSPRAADSRIAEAKQAGKRVTIIYTNTDAEQAFRWSLGRPRLMRAATVASSHARAADNIRGLAERYAADDRVRIVVVNNPGEASLVNVGKVTDVPAYDYNRLERRLHEIARQERDAGRLSRDKFAFVSGGEAVLHEAVGRPPEGTAGQGSEGLDADPAGRAGAPAGRVHGGQSAESRGSDGRVAGTEGVNAGQHGRPGAEGKVADAARQPGGQRRTGQVRGRPGQSDLFGNGEPDAGTADARGLGQPGPAGVRGQNEDGRGAESGGRDGRPAGVPAGRDIGPKSGLNYRFGDDDLTYEGSWAKKAAANVEAVELLKKLQAEGRQATRDEQKVLAQFIGWGASEIANNLFGKKLDKVADAARGYRAAKAVFDGGAARIDRYHSDYWAVFGPLSGKRNLRYGDPITAADVSLAAFGLDSADLKYLDLRDRLKAALTPDEWAEASRSTQYAHYTSKAVVRSMWGTLQRFGFEGGVMLEPGAGIGVFPGLMPEAMAFNSSYTGVEFDSITGGILKQLFPDERILVESFVDTALPKNFYDVAVGNPPFSGTKILSDPEYQKHAFSLHDYFFAKTIDRVKPGGLVVFVTSRYTMDKLTDKARQYLGERADLVGAIRLPQTAFKANAGTDVVTDVLFLRKKVPGETFEHGQAWAKSVPMKVGSQTFPVNEYFHAHPEMVLGSHSDTGSMQNSDEPQYTVLPPAGDIESLFAKASGRMPSGIYTPARGSAAEAAKVREIDFNPKAQKEGNYYVSDKGALMQRENGVGTRVELKSEKDMALIKAFVPLRDALKQAHYDQLNDGDWQTSLAALQAAYKAFTAKHGQVNQFVAKTVRVKVDELDDDGSPTGRKVEDEEQRRVYPLLEKIKDDPDWTLVAALEKVNDETGEITPSAFLSSRVLGKPERATIATPHDALLAVLNDTGRVDPAQIAARLDMSQADAIASLGSAVYEDPEASWVTADEYLSGNVKRKLEAARAAAKADRRFERNVKALEAVQPAPKSPAQINASIGMNWIPGSDYSQFLRETAGVRAEVRFNDATRQWLVRTEGGHSTLKATADWGTLDRHAGELLEHALTGRPIRITRSVGHGKDATTVFDATATEAANQKLDAMREEFSNWIWRDAERANRLVQVYNDRFNTTVPRAFDGRHLTLPGASKQFHIFDHVKRGAWRIVQRGNTYLAHAVGSGKTFQMVISAMEQKRLGLISKPMVVVPNHMLQQFAREWQDLYPAARLMVADEHNFHTDNRRRFVSRVALSELDGVVITHSAFKLLDLDPEFKQKIINEQLDYMRAALEEAEAEEGNGGRKSMRVKQIEKQIENLEQKLEAALSSVGKDRNVRFDELGVDFLYVDEAHEFRKLDFATARQVKGIQPAGSARALDLYIKSRYLEEKKPGRSLVMASGTPVTNTLAELYTVGRFMDRQTLIERGIEDFDSWASMFGRERTALEPNAAGKYEPVTRFSKFVNVPELTQMFRDYADVVTADQLAALLGDKRPKVEGGARKIVITPKTEAYASYQKVLAQRVEISKNWKPTKDEPNNPDPVIRIIGDGRLAAIDMRFVNPSAPSDPRSKLNTMIDDVVRVFKETADVEYLDKAGNVEASKGSAMMVFSDLGFGAGVAASRGFNARAWFEKRLRDAGVPMGQVAFMSDYKKSTDKLKLFKDVNAGRVRILIGSSKNMGTGVNAQQRLKALFHLDSPWYPADLEQREGRIIRQGNKNRLVQVFAYAAKGTYDENMWKMLASKQFFIDQALNGDENLREVEDLDSQSQYDMAAAMVAEDPRVMQLAGARAEIEKLQRLFRAHEDQRMGFRNTFRFAQETIEFNTKRLPDAQKLAGQVQDLSGDKFRAKADSSTFDDRTKWGEALLAKFADLKAKVAESQAIGEVSGFKVRYVSVLNSSSYTAQVQLATPEPTLLISDGQESAIGVAMRAQNAVADVARQPERMREAIAAAQARMDALRERLEAPFPMAGMLADKVKEAADLEAQLAAAGKPRAWRVERVDTGLGHEVQATSAEEAIDKAVATNGGLPAEWRAYEATPGGEAAGDDARLSIGAGGGVDFKALLGVAARVRRSMPGLPKINVLTSPASAPAELQAYIRARGAMATADGAFHNGEIYLFASGIADEARAEHVLAEHEAAHAGLAGLLGAALPTTMRMIANNNAAVRKAALQVQQQHGLTLAQAVEEVLVDMPSAGLARLKGWRGLVGKVRDALKAAGFERLAARVDAWLAGHLTDQQRADLFVADLVREARAFVGRPQTENRGFNVSGRSALSVAATAGTQPVGTVEQRADALIQASASTPKPLDAAARMLTRVSGVEKFASVLYGTGAKLIQRLVPERMLAGVVSDYGVPEAVIDQRAMMQGRQRQALRGAGTLLEKLATLTRAESRVAYEWMTGEDTRTADDLMKDLPEQSVKVLQEVRQLVDKLSQEAVRLGQLDPEAFERHRFAYLRRSYFKHAIELTSADKAKRQRAITILGDQYKGRGMTAGASMKQVQNVAPEWWKRKFVPGKADTSLKGEKFVRLERRAPSGAGTAALEGMEGKRPGKLLEVHFFPAGEPMPAKYADWDNAGTWEVVGTKGPELVVWRDFTKDERSKMGEIDEARFAIAKTLQAMVHDIEVGRYLEWLAQRYAKKPGEAIDGVVVEASERYRDTFKTGEWVQVPDAKIPGTSVAKYGKLAGHYLPGPIWNDLRQVVNGRFQPLGETYQRILSMWKASKTALSPAVHTNNVMSNFVMADWHDVTAGHVAKSLRIILGASKRQGAGVIGRVGNVAARAGMADAEAARAILARYEDSGGAIGGWVTQEIANEQLEPIVAALERELAGAAAATGAETGVYAALQHALGRRFPAAWEALKGSKPGGAVATEAKALLDLYQAEDDVFRLAAWLKAKEAGLSDAEAGKIARRSFLDYSINAPWVQAMRSTAFPFISFTYRALPMLLETMGKRPHKIIKLMALAGALNWLGVMLGGGGDDRERKLLSEEKAGGVWGMVPKLIRMPWNDANGSPVYLDIRRWIPVGDVADLGQGHAALPLPPALMPGGPLAVLGEVITNHSMFTGKAITLDTDTATEKAGKLADHLWKAAAPNVLGLPGTYATQGVVDAAKGRTDAFGREQSVAQALASTVGVKLGSYPADVLRRNLIAKNQAEEMEIDRNIAQLKRQRQTNRISQEELQAEVRKQLEKKQEIRRKLAEQLR